jgi:hypothetical protein
MRKSLLSNLNLVAIFFAIALTGCEQASTQDSETRLIYLAPQMPCEAGEPGFGQPNCSIKRMRDVTTVLRVPKNYGNKNNYGLADSFMSQQLVVEPNSFLVQGSGDSYKEKEIIKKMQAAMKNGASSDKQNSFYMNLDWSWGFSTGNEGQSRAYSDMESWYKNTGNKVGNEGANYIEIASPADEFKTYAMKRCVDHYARVSSTKGTLTPQNSCDIAGRYYLPINDAKTYVNCNAPFILDDKINDGLYCKMHSYFTLRQVDGKPFNIYYTYSPTWEHMKSGHWKYLNQRFEAWVKSMDVTDQELSRSKK